MRAYRSPASAREPVAALVPNLPIISAVLWAGLSQRVATLRDRWRSPARLPLGRPKAVDAVMVFTRKCGQPRRATGKGCRTPVDSEEDRAVAAFPVARSIARAVYGASGMVTNVPPLWVIVRVRCPRSLGPGA
jgi:hypothetical protein